MTFMRIPRCLAIRKIYCSFYEVSLRGEEKVDIPGIVFVPFENLHNFAVPKVIDCYFRVKSIFL